MVRVTNNENISFQLTFISLMGVSGGYQFVDHKYKKSVNRYK